MGKRETREQEREAGLCHWTVKCITERFLDLALLMAGYTTGGVCWNDGLAVVAFCY